MGLFKFIKEAGAKIFGGGAQAATPEKLQQEVQGHGFDAGKLGIQVELIALLRLKDRLPSLADVFSGLA